MASVTCSERQLLEEDSTRKASPRLKARAKVEVEADVCVVTVLIVGGILDGQDVERYHHTIYGHQHRLLLLVHLSTAGGSGLPKLRGLNYD